MGQSYALQNRELIIQVRPRIHVTLIGMDRDGFRINGGCGFAIQEPSLELSISRSSVFSLRDCRKYSLPATEAQRLSNVLNIEKDYLRARHNLNITISGEMPTHYGFGSDTAIRLGCMEALYILNGFAPVPDKVVMSSGRGGTSGVGINTYFTGGFIIDLGRKTDLTGHCQSSMAENRHKLPLLMKHLDMPEWDIGICIPNIRNKSEKEEKEFFQKTCPIPTLSVHETLYNVIFGLCASIKEIDKETFCMAIENIQKCAWKSAERNEYGKRLRIIEEQLYNAGARSVGMSSLGPSLYFFAENIDDVIAKMRALKVNGKLLKTKPANCGRSIIHV